MELFKNLVEVLKNYGPLMGTLTLAVLFFLYRDWQREKSMTERIVHLENEVRNIIMPMVEQCTTVIAKNTTVIDRFERILDTYIWKRRD